MSRTPPKQPPSPMSWPAWWLIGLYFRVRLALSHVADRLSAKPRLVFGLAGIVMALTLGTSVYAAGVALNTSGGLKGKLDALETRLSHGADHRDAQFLQLVDQIRQGQVATHNTLCRALERVKGLDHSEVLSSLHTELSCTPKIGDGK